MVYVDYSIHLESSNPKAFRVGERHNHEWCHLWADSFEELMDFAQAIGMKREWLQKNSRVPHFDLIPTKRVMAIAKGAQEMSLKEWLKKQHCL
jgi:hypothetical protein